MGRDGGGYTGDLLFLKSRIFLQKGLDKRRQARVAI
jgi:hypothetical protein